MPSGKLVLALSAVLLGGGCAQGSKADDQGGPTSALVGATILDGTGGPAIEDGVLVFSSGKIDCVGGRSDCPVPEGAETQDVTRVRTGRGETQSSLKTTS